MFDLFKKDENKSPADVKEVRHSLLQFIKQELQKAEGGEGRNIKGINLFICSKNNEKHIYEAAVYLEEEGRFKNEVQKIADDYALNLPQNWVMNIDFPDEMPPEAIKITNLDAGMFIRTKDNTIQKNAAAYIRILSGEAVKQEYQITSTDGKINIGRERRAQVADGFFRLNHIAFPGDSTNENNKFISRQHAHIEWDNDSSCFMFFADEGGVPPGNKVKIRSATNEHLIKLNSVEMGHRLEEGDQIVLGESAVIEFSYKAEI
ncbi:MAG: hypothetical protein JWR67_2799 [Mucilaginibacter sp.]|jgi:hypothetical protein|nr:hypothetical protein [Mucilaginibacter sp.]